MCIQYLLSFWFVFLLLILHDSILVLFVSGCVFVLTGRSFLLLLYGLFNCLRLKGVWHIATTFELTIYTVAKAFQTAVLKI